MWSYILERRCYHPGTEKAYQPKYGSTLAGVIKPPEEYVSNKHYDAFLESYHTDQALNQRTRAFLGPTAANKLVNFDRSNFTVHLAENPESQRKSGEKLQSILQGDDNDARKDLLKFFKTLRNDGAIKALEPHLDGELFSFNLKSCILKAFFKHCGDGRNKLPSKNELWHDADIPSSMSASHQQKFAEGLEALGLSLPDSISK